MHVQFLGLISMKIIILFTEKMAKHSKFAMGAILMKIVILSCRLGGILFRLENAPGCAPIS